MNDAPLLQLGGLQVGPPSNTSLRIALMLWGEAGCGKTTLASTAPGKKLWLLTDVDGLQSFAGRDDIIALDLSGMSYLAVTEKFRSDDPFNITKFLVDNPDIETVVIDSLTTMAYAMLLYAVSKNKSSTIEQPGMHAYTYRNATLLRAMQSLLTITKKLNRHIIFIAHEGPPEKNDDGAVVKIPMALSANAATQVGIRMNEVWWMTDNGKTRKIAVRPCRMRDQMKSRMWNAPTPEFDWRYNADSMKGDGLREWHKAWQEGGGTKLPFPK